MDRQSRQILQKTMRFLSLKGYQVLTEFALPNKKRVDIIAINSKKKIIIVEVKSNKKSLRVDKKWKHYLSYCNYFFFAVNGSLKLKDYSNNVGVIQNSQKGTKIVKKSNYKNISESKKKLFDF